jgi:hypothetical protein
VASVGICEAVTSRNVGVPLETIHIGLRGRGVDVQPTDLVSLKHAHLSDPG